MAQPAALSSPPTPAPVSDAVLRCEPLAIGMGGGAVLVPELKIAKGGAAILSPQLGPGAEAGGDLAAAVARVMATLVPPERGKLLIFELDPWQISYLELCRLRRRLGFVPGRGGLLSNRTLLDNAALPLSVHTGVDHSREQEQAQDALHRLGIGALAQRFPHAIDGPARFAACTARAMILDPGLLVVEGIGDFEAESDGSHAWRVIANAVAAQSCALVVCPGKPQPAFERWWQQRGAEIAAVTRIPADAHPTARQGAA